MAEEQKKNKKENAKNPDSAREDLDQFTVMQELEDLHGEELSARELEADGRGVSQEDAASQGALGQVQNGDDFIGVVDVNGAPTVEGEGRTELSIELESSEIIQDISQESTPDTLQAAENIDIDSAFQAQDFDGRAIEIDALVTDDSRSSEIGLEDSNDAADIVSTGVSDNDGFGQADALQVATSPDDITPEPDPTPDLVPEPVALDTNIRVRVSHATDNQTDINSEDGYDFTVFEYGVPYIVTGAEMDIAGVSDEAQIQYIFSDADTVEVTLLTPWNTVKNIEVFSDVSGNVTLNNFVHTDVVLGDGGDSTILIDGAKRGNITTGDGNDSVEVNSFTNNAGWSNDFNIDTGAGADTIDLTGDKGLTQFNVDAGEGNDQVVIDGDYYASQAHLGSGDDSFTGGSGDDTLYGGDGNDTLNGGDGNDGLSCGAGDDVLNGGSGDDILYGGEGDDVLDGGDGSDTLIGGEGTDTLIGGSGSDILTGGDGKDTFIITSGDGDVTITDFGGVGGGGTGEAALIGNHDTIKLDGESLTADNMLLEFDGTNTVMTFEGVDEFSVTLENFDFTDLDNLPANSSFNILFDGQEAGTDAYDVFNDHSNSQHGIWNTDSVTHLNDADNTVNGRNNSDDVINGMEGDDTISGKGGDDTLRGQSADDTLTGGQGDDVLDGGTGDDVAVFTGVRSEYSVTQNGDGSYTVTDNVAGRDGTDTVNDVETFRFADGDLSEGADVLVEFECETTVELSFVNTNAGYNNTIGVYTIAEDGSIGNVEIAFDNVKDNAAGDTYEMSVTGDDAAQFGFFIIADGARENGDFDNFDLENGDLQFVFDQGGTDERPATIHDDPSDVSLVYSDGETTAVVDGNIYHDTPDLNPSDLDHVQESDIDGGGQRLGFEDLPNLGDQDYNDVTIDVSVTKETVPVSDTDDSQEDDNGSGDDVVADDGNNGHGNDADGVDDSNPGQGHAHDSDDGNNGHGNDADGVDDSNPGQGSHNIVVDNDMPAMMDNSAGNGWTDMVESDEAMMSVDADNSSDEAWTDAVEEDGSADNDNSAADSDDSDDNPLDGFDADMDEIPAMTDDQSGTSDGAFG